LPTLCDAGSFPPRRSFARAPRILLLAAASMLAVAAAFLPREAVATTCVGGINVTSVSPASGAVGATVTVQTDCGLTVTAVQFGGTTAAINTRTTTIHSSTTTVTVPAGAGTVDIRVTHGAGGTSAISAADRFTYTTGATAGSSGNTNNVGGSLHQSTREVTHQSTASSIATITNTVESGIAGQFGGGIGALGAAPAGGVSSSEQPDPGNPHPGLTGYGISGRQAFTMLAQAAGSILTQSLSDASGGLPPDPAKPGANRQQALTLGPSSLGFGSNKPYGAFLMGSYSGVGSNQAGGQFSGSIQNVIAGGDYKFTPNLLAGLALGYETSSINTAYNFGSLKGSGFTVMPYVAWHQGNIQWDAMIGGGALGYKIAQNTNTPATGSYGAQRFSFKTNLTADYDAFGFRLSPTVGLLSAFEFDNAYTDSNGNPQPSSSVRILRPSAGGEIGYDWAVPRTSLVLGPYGKALLQYDILQSGRATLTNGTLASETTLSGVLGGGLRARITDYLSAMIDTYNTVGAANISQWVTTGEVRLDLPF
jgi:hypothetical protein